MRLEKVLDLLNSFEKNSFLKVVSNLIDGSNANAKEIDIILSASDNDLKGIDNRNVSKVFGYVSLSYLKFVKNQLSNSNNQLDILLDIIIRDGNCIMSREWFDKLYEIEIKNFKKRLKEFKGILESDSSEQRVRDIKIYYDCLHTAYYNEEANNGDLKVTTNEQSILNRLAKSLGLSQEDVKLLTYQIIPLKKLDIDTIVNDLKDLGIIFYKKTTHQIYIPDELVCILRQVRGKRVADKYFRRLLRLLKDPQINMVCKAHGIDWREGRDQKINNIINDGVDIIETFEKSIYKEDLKINDRKLVINDLVEKGLRITPPLKGATISEKLENLIEYFVSHEADDKITITMDGYEKLLLELSESLPKVNTLAKEEFELQDEFVLKGNYLVDYNIKPEDLLEIIPEEDLKKFAEQKEIKTRGDIVHNIMEGYKDAENLYIENYENIGFRKLLELKENGLSLKEADLGLKFEEITKTVLSRMGLTVDEKLRKQLNTSKDKIDIIVNLGEEGLIIIECKSVKESGYNKFSSVSRQLGSYKKLCESNGYKVFKILLVAPDFSDEFVEETEYDIELNLSLVRASALLKIMDAFKSSKHKKFPHLSLLRDVLIKEDRIIKVLSK